MGRITLIFGVLVVCVSSLTFVIYPKLTKRLNLEIQLVEVDVVYDGKRSQVVYQGLARSGDIVNLYYEFPLKKKTEFVRAFTDILMREGFNRIAFLKGTKTDVPASMDSSIGFVSSMCYENHNSLVFISYYQGRDTCSVVVMLKN